MWLIPWSGSRGLVQARIRARGRQNRLAAAADGLRGDPGFVDVWCKCSAFSLGTKQTEEFQKDPEVVLAAIRGPKGHWDAISAGSPEVQGSRRQLVGLCKYWYWRSATSITPSRYEVWEHIEVPRAAAETGGWTVHDIAPHELQASFLLTVQRKASGTHVAHAGWSQKGQAVRAELRAPGLEKLRHQIAVTSGSKPASTGAWPAAGC